MIEQLKSSDEEDDASSSTPSESGKVVLYDRSTMLANDGRGVFKTFHAFRMKKITSPPSIKQVPTSPSDLLRIKFVQMVDILRPVSSFLWDKWMLLVASRLGKSAVLDDATECFVAGCMAYVNRTDESLKAARRVYGPALCSMRRALKSEDRYSSETLIASKFLASFEVSVARAMAVTRLLTRMQSLTGLGNKGWRFHYQGLGALLASRGYRIHEDDMVRALYFAVLPHEFNEAIGNGTDSAFDIPGWLHCPAPEYGHDTPIYQVVYGGIMRIMVRIPRLVRLVREVRADPYDFNAAAKAASLAEELHQTDLQPLIDDLMFEYCEKVPTRDPALAAYFSESIHFLSKTVFVAMLRYCACRIIVIGLCRQLVETGLLLPVQSTSTLEEQERDCAGKVAMAFQYAEELRYPLPMGAYMMMVPMRVAFGSWFRMERDAERVFDVDSEDSAALTKARFMMDWCKTKGNDLVETWECEPMSSDMLKAQMKIMEGGALQSNRQKTLPM